MTQPAEQSDRERAEKVVKGWGKSFDLDTHLGLKLRKSLETAIAASYATIRRQSLLAAAKWHDQRAKDTPDAFEMELHQASAKHFRKLIDGGE